MEIGSIGGRFANITKGVLASSLGQINETTYMTSLDEGKLNDKPTFTNFDDDTTHRQFWPAEFDSTRRYYIEPTPHSGAFYHYNPYVMK